MLETELGLVKIAIMLHLLLAATLGLCHEVKGLLGLLCEGLGALTFMGVKGVV